MLLAAHALPAACLELEITESMLMAEFGCDLAQGYHLARPLPADGLLALLERERDEPLRLAAR